MQAKDYVLHMVGNAHIDPTWLWRWTEGYAEVRATFQSALDRMNETPEFTFTASSACFYAWVKQCDPEMFEAIRARLRQGRWEIAGGWWIEPDCNIPEGESFVRHGLYGQRFFEREFGIRVTVGFNPDSFGHAGALPQIFKKMGIDYYAYSRPQPHEFQYAHGIVFTWRAKDGSEILACEMPEGYGSQGGAPLRERMRTMPDHPARNPGQTHILCPYGVGNHGGGPTKECIAEILCAQEDDTMPNPKFSTLETFFRDFTASTKDEDIPVIDTDLQMHAVGCYSVHSEIKRLNRQAEHALMAAERWATAAWLALRRPYPAAEIERAWRDVLYNQFHDILAGTSIETAYADARDQFGRARRIASEITNEAIQTMAQRIDTAAEGNTLIVFNSLPWRVKGPVIASDIIARQQPESLAFDKKPLCVVDDAGQPVPCQALHGEKIGGFAYTLVADVPALGYRCYHARFSGEPAVSGRPLSASPDFLENDWWRIELDPLDGHIARLYDKQHAVEVLEAGNVLACLADSTDTWSHGVDRYGEEVGRFRAASTALVETGPVQATLKIVSAWRDSTVEQFVTLYRDIDVIDCTFRINWQERRHVLKLAYDTFIENAVAVCETPYCWDERPSTGIEFPGQKWLDLTGAVAGKPYGLAVLNDCKHGFDVQGRTMRVTLLRSPHYAHHDPWQPDAAESVAIIDQGWQTVRTRLVPHAGTWQDARVPQRAWELNEPPIAHHEYSHPGSWPGSGSFLGVDSAHVLLTVLKKSEDGDDLILRGYEVAGRHGEVAVDFPQAGKSVRTSFSPHEIKTLRVNPSTWDPRKVNLLEE
ncbi:MAG TPA: alpha-mannosidase [Candidatus Hydrogenedentes bacterium]|nr:alpha-mannosidase [Candidatus Hydrogenedentota bacterium]HIJ72813.1 alpha-mannosidase [Candidatus Hydrogenedentota bacterium]